MFAPMYQELHVDRRDALATSLTWPTQSSSFASKGSMVRAPASSIRSKQCVIQSTCCSMAGIMLAKTDGLPGPVTVKKFGNPADVRPRYVLGPAFHFSFNVMPFRPVIRIRSSDPVIAANPVAHTMASKS